MTQQPEDEEREERISMEIIVDSYGIEEQAMGWYYYLDGKMHFPFSARCVAQRAISPLEPGEEVEVVGMAPVEECDHKMFVMVKWRSRTLGVPLMQLEGIEDCIIGWIGDMSCKRRVRDAQLSKGSP